MFWFSLCSLGSFIDLSPQFIIIMTRIRKGHSWLMYDCWINPDKWWWLVLISHYLIRKNNYVVPNFNYGMLYYVTISTSSWYVPVIGFIGSNNDDDDCNFRLITRNLKIAPLDGGPLQKIRSRHLVCVTETRPPVSSRSEHCVVVTSRCEPM
jgi:hypothetical protein